MVKVKNPLMSFDAAGKFADAVVYQKNLYGNIARVHIDKNPHTSIKQSAYRSEFGEAAEAWRFLDGAIKRAYSDSARKERRMGYQIFLREYSQTVAGSEAGVAVVGVTFAGYHRVVKSFKGFVVWP